MRVNDDQEKLMFKEINGNVTKFFISQRLRTEKTNQDRQRNRRVIISFYYEPSRNFAW